MFQRLFRALAKKLVDPIPPELIDMPALQRPGFDDVERPTMRVEAATCFRCGRKYPKHELVRMVNEETKGLVGLICKPCIEIAELADHPQVGYINTLIPGERVTVMVSAAHAKLLLLRA